MRLMKDFCHDWKLTAQDDDEMEFIMYSMMGLCLIPCLLILYIVGSPLFFARYLVRRSAKSEYKA